MKTEISPTLKAGVRICTRGRREILVHGKCFAVTQGVAVIQSPAILIYELTRSEDYEEEVLVEDLAVFYEVVRTRLNTIMGMRLWARPCIHLPQDYIDLFLRRKREIDEKYNMMESTDDEEERNMLRQMGQLLAKEMVIEFIYLAHRNQAVSPKEVKRNEAVTFQFLFSLNTSKDNIRSVSHYASEANLSMNHFTRIIKQSTGRTPSQWIAEVTMLHAKNLLNNLELSIKEVAAQLNFPEQFTFRKFFKSNSGMSPTDYRRSISKT